MKWNLKKGDAFLPGVSLNKLKSMYAVEKGKAKIRLLCAIKRREGLSMYKIAEQLCVSRSTIRDWIYKFQTCGLCVKDDRKAPGGKPKLSPKQQAELVECLLKGPPGNPGGLWSTKGVVCLIRKKFNVSLSHSRVWVILQKLGFSIQRPRKRHYKAASKKEQEAFKKKSVEW
jgi:transposase